MPTMRRLAVIPVLAIVASAVLVALTTFSEPHWAQGIILPTPPPFGVALVVNTPSDLVDPLDGTCSLRAAIAATNINGHAGNCDASLSQAGATDGITFNIGTGTPVIDIGSTPLPVITDKLGISGNTGGADRVEIRGPGGPLVSGHHGLTIASTAAGTLIRNLVIDYSADDGIRVDAANVTLLGNYIGTNAAGTAGPGNQGYGVQVTSSGVHIGGATSGGACTGDCNLISGNLKDDVLLDTPATSAIVRGNFIGPNVTGTGYLSPQYLVYGIDVKGANNTIGGSSGTTPGGSCTGDCNLISANDTGVYVAVGASGTQVLGNFIGTNVTGTGAIYGNSGIIDAGDDLTVGGSNPSSRNLISGNNLDGIDSNGGLTARGNFIGTNSAGSAALPNGGQGVNLTGPNVRMGGTSGTTPGGSCTGDCNLISGNTFTGILINSTATGAQIEGNFIGTDVSGTTAIGNATNGAGHGIDVRAAGTIAGGVTPAARNVLSGNGLAQVHIKGVSAIVQGNYIGTNSMGTATLIGRLGILLEGGDGSLIGGTAVGDGNLISGSNGYGSIFFETSSNVQVQGNLIGTAADGVTALPEISNGIFMRRGSSNNVIGGTAAGSGNTIAFSNNAGVVVDGSSPGASTGNSIRGNSIYGNADQGIKNVSGGNNELAPPAITGINPVTGTACTKCTIEVFSDADGQGKIFEGTSMADNAGNWSFNTSVAGPDVTATATDLSNNTSEFSAPFAVPTPTPSPSPTPTQTPSPTPTATPTGHPSPTVPPCGSPQYRGDADGNGHVDIHDVLATLSALAHVPPGAACAALAEVDCDGELAADDALRILDFVAGTPLAQPTNCPGVGTLT